MTEGQKRRVVIEDGVAVNISVIAADRNRSSAGVAHAAS